MNRGKAWATVAFLLGIGVSVAANVAHTYHPSAEVLRAAGRTAATWRPELGAQAMAAFYPLGLLLVVEILARAPWPHTWGWSAARYGGASVVAGVTAVVSYRHMAGLLSAYGEDSLTAAIGPLAVDGLMVVASFALLAIGQAKAVETVQVVEPSPAVELESATDREPVVAAWEWWPLPTMAVERASEPDVPEIEAAVPEPDAGAPDVPEPYLEAAQVFAAELERGRVPGIRAIKRELRVGQPKAAEVRQHLAVLASR